MIIDRRRLLLIGDAMLAALALRSLGAPVHAETYPARPATIIVPFGAGTVTDTVARMLADHLQRSFGRPFIVENKGGANGMIGASFVARARPDGYTLLFSTNTTQSAITSLFKSVPYDPLKDFAPVGRLVDLPSLLVVNNKLPVKTVQDFIAYAKSHPHTLQYGYGNVSGQIAGEMLKKRTGIDMTAVPYRGNPQGLTDLMAGSIAAMVVDTGTGLPQVAAGTVRPLAMVSPDRSALLADLPTLSETVTPGFGFVAWGGLFAPAGTPPEIVTTLAKASETLVTAAEFKAKVKNMGVEAKWTGPQAFPDFLKAESVRWSSMVKEAGIVPQ